MASDGQGGTGRRPGQRAGVTRAAVVAAARALVAEEGLDALSMRRLAAALGVMPNALYSHFPDKTAIVDAVVDHVLGEIPIPDPTAGAWQDGLAALMRASRRQLLAHPRLVPVVLARPGGPNAFRLGEATLQLLARGGVHGERAVEACRALLVYTIGSAAIEVPRATDPRREARLAAARAFVRSLPADRFPLTRANVEPLVRHPDEAAFEAGLRWLLRGIAAGE